MLNQETLQLVARQLHTSDHPNAVREYCQHLFLSSLYKLEMSDNLLFKGGTALRIVFNSPRFSEDLDFSLFNIPTHRRQQVIEDLFEGVMVTLEQQGLQVVFGKKFGPTPDGYFGSAEMQFYDYPNVTIEINISTRNGRPMSGQVASIANDFVPTYNLFHLPVVELVEEKVFSALLQRHKARDFYDLYFIMRKGLLVPDQKRRLANLQEQIKGFAQSINFQDELGVLLPSDQQAVVKDFGRTLSEELGRQISN